MAYSLEKPVGSHGLNPIPVPDNAIDTTYWDNAVNVGFQLVGRNAVDYGTAVAQNTVQMVSNFAGPLSSIPNDNIALQGQLWFNSTSATTGILYVRTRTNSTGGILNWQKIVTEDSTGNINVDDLTVAGDATIGDDLTVGGDVTIGGHVIYSFSNVTATGSNPVLTKSINMITGGTGGVTLPVAATGLRIIVRNGTASNINVEPNGASSTINAGAAGAPYVLVPGAMVEFICAVSGASGKWYTMNSTYA